MGTTYIRKFNPLRINREPRMRSRAGAFLPSTGEPKPGDPSQKVAGTTDLSPFAECCVYSWIRGSPKYYPQNQGSVLRFIAYQHTTELTLTLFHSRLSVYISVRVQRSAPNPSELNHLLQYHDSNNQITEFRIINQGFLHKGLIG